MDILTIFLVVAHGGAADRFWMGQAENHQQAAAMAQFVRKWASGTRLAVQESTTFQVRTNHQRDAAVVFIDVP